VSRFYKLALDGICNTLRAGTASDRGAFTSPRPIHPVYPRCISVREAARLHSYPDWFRFHRTIWHGFRQIGNSVPPLLGRAVGARIAEALGVVPCKPTEVLELGPEELAAFNMKQAADHFSVSPKVIPPRKRLNAVS
jgi:DNA (cytosine-5)-methyltransferase 1